MSWMNKKKDELQSIKQIERALLNKQSMRVALNRYVFSLDLQGQINRGVITDQQAVQLFRKAIQDFSYQLNQAINNTINNAIKNKKLDQSDLSNPLSMQSALDNPDSFASQMMNEAAAAVIVACNEESMSNEQQQVMAQQMQQTAPENQSAVTPSPTPTSHDNTEKEKLLVEAALGVAAGKEILDHTVEKFIGKKLEKKLDVLSGKEESLEKEVESPFKIPTLKPRPEPPKNKDEK